VGQAIKFFGGAMDDMNISDHVVKG